MIVPLDPLLNLIPFCVEEFWEAKSNVIGEEELPFAVNVPLKVSDDPLAKNKFDSGKTVMAAPLLTVKLLRMVSCP